jgi:hypothetical protein
MAAVVSPSASGFSHLTRVLSLCVLVSVATQCGTAGGNSGSSRAGTWFVPRFLANWLFKPQVHVYRRLKPVSTREEAYDAFMGCGKIFVFGEDYLEFDRQSLKIREDAQGRFIGRAALRHDGEPAPWDLLMWVERNSKEVSHKLTSPSKTAAKTPPRQSASMPP